MKMISKIKDRPGWIKIERLDEILFTAHIHIYMVYCEKANLLFRKPKTGEFIAKMFRAGEATYYKEAQGNVDVI